MKSVFSLPCGNSSFCFNCISNSSCTWQFNDCQEKNSSPNNNKPEKIHDLTPEKCFRQNDIQTLNYIETYCGNTSYYFKDNTEEISFSLPVHNKTLYGVYGLYCEYSIYNYDEIESFTIETKNNWGKLKMRINYLYSDGIREIFLSDGDTNVIKDSREIKIIFESNNQKSSKPFSIIITDTYKSVKMIIYLVIILCAFVVLVILLIVIICIKRRKRIYISDNIINNIDGMYFNNNINDINNTERIDFMNYLKQMKTKKYKEIQNENIDIINNKCPIDIENFEPDDDVIINKCRHLFHYDCLKTFIEKNKTKKEFKCPLCNNPLFDIDMSEKIDEKNNKNNVHKK
jgi:hypothetical protein